MWGLWRNGKLERFYGEDLNMVGNIIKKNKHTNKKNSQTKKTHKQTHTNKKKLTNKHTQTHLESANSQKNGRQMLSSSV